MYEWVFEPLARFVDAELCEELVRYINEIENESEFDEYIGHFLDFSDKDQREIYENIKTCKFGGGSNNNSKNISTFKNSSVLNTSDSDAQSTQKKSKKFIKFQLSELQKGYLKEGRNPCECQATKHKLINNCIECGRIICEQEGSGPCFFCDNMVCTKEEHEILNSNTREANVLYRTLTERKKTEGWKKAVDHRNTLLDFDKNCVKRTTVIDDEHDYFEINRWMSKKEREVAAKKSKKSYEQKYGSRLGARKMTFDLSERRAVDEGFSFDDDKEEETSDRENENISYHESSIPDIDAVLKSLQNLNSSLKLQEPGIKREVIPVKGSDLIQKNYVIQDKMFLEMRDMGMCLSMHQPWASLLVNGIKKHEGRTWYTPHRGTLWIAAASKPPEPQDIQECEEFYKEYYKGEQIQFPEDYPTGCLLGCVLVQDCLSQEEYFEQYPNGESNSPHVMICSDPQKLPVAFPVQGEHKIYKLKSDIHKMAREALIVKRRR